MHKNSNIIFFENFPLGRFANACFQILYAEYLKKLGYTVILGSPKRPRSTDLPWELFDLEENNNDLATLWRGFLGEERSAGPEPSLQIINEYFKSHPGTVLTIDGYFQFDTNNIRSDPNYFLAFEENLGINGIIKTPFQRIVKKYNLKIKGDYLITIHIRRGDYLTVPEDHVNKKSVFYTLDLENVVSNLQKYITKNRIRNPIIYISTDDIVFCKSFFNNKKIKIFCSEDFVDKEDNNHLMCDLSAMTAANLFIASNSSLSILGAMLNNTGKVFWRQDEKGELISFDPWFTPILFGL
jgi:hypothetical protein